MQVHAIPMHTLQTYMFCLTAGVYYCYNNNDDDDNHNSNKKNKNNDDRSQRQ